MLAALATHFGLPAAKITTFLELLEGAFPSSTERLSNLLSVALPRDCSQRISWDKCLAAYLASLGR